MLGKLIIGVTGPTGAGKSSLREVFRQRGIAVIDSDLLAREVVEPGTPALAELAGAFGDGILLPDGSLDRKALAAAAFSSPERSARLGAITHPRITELLLRRVDALPEGSAAAVEAPLLFESGFDKECDAVIAVIAPPDVRLERVMRRDGISRDEALGRMRAQQSEEYYAARTPYVIENSGDVGELLSRAGEVIDRIMKS